MSHLKGKTLIISGASRGIGLSIGLRAARDGANVAILAKTAEPDPRLEGTIFTAAEEIEMAGGKALPILCDIRDDARVTEAVEETVKTFGGIDICVNNASAIMPVTTLDLPMKRFDLMHQVNTRGTFLLSKLTAPYLMQSDVGHILNLSPPLDMDPKWFGPHVGYTIAKYGMSLCVLGMAQEWKGKIAVNALWPRTAIATAAIKNVLAGEEGMAMCRTPQILADAAYAVFGKPKGFTGNFLIDDTFLHQEGVSEFAQYRVDPSKPLMPDFFVPENIPAPPGVKVATIEDFMASNAAGHAE
jgi:citronellol/citronellal dehydrogenase